MSSDEEQVWSRTADEVIAALGSDRTRGLTSGEAARRLVEFGRNELDSTPPVPAWRQFLAQFTDLLVVLLLTAAAISTALWIWERDAAAPYEAIAIFAVVLLNATMGFVQESRAKAAVAALRAMSAAEAHVVRDGQPRRVAASELVPGDVVLVAEGDTVPADARILESISLKTAEAALTGESLPVTKDPLPVASDAAPGDRRNMLFSGTSAAYGHGQALVTATGMQTEMGRIAHLLEATGDEITPLQHELDRVGRILGTIVVIIAVVMVTTIVLVEHVRDTSTLVEVLILGVALAVAAVPEGLPAVVTAVLSIGVQRMARRNAIVQHLAAVETLGSASTIASDKTGTLTRNEMSVRTVVTASGRVTFEGSGYEPAGAVHRADDGPVHGDLRIELERALTVAGLTNNASLQLADDRWVIHGDPTEAALIVAARKAGLSEETLSSALPRIAEVPFSSERKLMSTIHHTIVDAERRSVVFTKGAPDVLLARCEFELVGDERRPLDARRRTAIEAINESLADDALRTLGVAARWLADDSPHTDASGSVEPEVEEHLVFIGLIGMMDPPRAEAKDAVARARSAGIRPIMITGDHPRTASVIACELGISQDRRVVTGADLESMSGDELARTVQEVSVYARVNPEHKLRLVAALQAGGSVVAMTGDGVNDAPALKKADIGIAMGITGTDVSKEAADIVLSDDNFASIVAAVEEGRAIFTNIRKFLRYLLSSNIGEVFTMFFGVVFASRLGLVSEETVVLPLLATQILWINLVTDGPPALALGVDPPHRGLMQRRPRPASERVITPQMWRGILIVGIVMAAGTLFILDASMPGGMIDGEGTLRYGQTMAFTTLMLFQIFNVVNARSDERSAFVQFFTNRWLAAAVAGSVLLQVAVVYTPMLQKAFGTVPLSPGDWARSAAVASSVLWVREVTKIWERRRTAAAARNRS